jgi:hypothetical protein
MSICSTFATGTEGFEGEPSSMENNLYALLAGGYGGTSGQSFILRELVYLCPDRGQITHLFTEERRQTIPNLPTLLAYGRLKSVSARETYLHS